MRRVETTHLSHLLGGRCVLLRFTTRLRLGGDDPLLGCCAWAGWVSGGREGIREGKSSHLEPREWRKKRGWI